jgi:hypothetical protein
MEFVDVLIILVIVAIVISSCSAFIKARKDGTISLPWANAVPVGEPDEAEVVQMELNLEQTSVEAGTAAQFPVAKATQVATRR